MLKFLVRFEPVLSAGSAQAVLALIIALGFHLSAGVTGSIEAVAAALLGLVAAASVKPFAPAAVIGLLTAIGTLLISSGVPHRSSGVVSAVNAVVAIALALILRGHVTPVPAKSAAPSQRPPTPAAA